jgi:hypothetical protein
MEDKAINPEESLKIITNMIDSARNKLADDGFYFIFWGWLVTGCALTHYFCLKAELYNSYWIWPVAMPIGGLISFIHGRRENRRKKAKTYLDSHLSYLWAAVLTAMFLCLVCMSWNGFRQTYFFLMLLYGIGSLITGGLINFKPLIYGSLFSFALACLSLFLSDADLLLCISGALIFSHIIPGHLLRHSFKSQYV